MFTIFRNDEKKIYLACQSQKFADAQGGIWLALGFKYNSFDLAIYEARKLAALNLGYTACGGGVVSPPAE